MKPIKQTIYLPVSDFHSSERAICTIGIPDLYGDRVIEKEGYFFTSEQLNEYTQSVIKQALETAAENSETRVKIKLECTNKELEGGFTIGQTEIIVDKQSITNTFEETYNKLKL